MELSNKSLAILMLAVVAVSLISTITAVNRLRSIELPVPTGYLNYNTSGTANLTILSNIEITFDVDNINFCAGYIADTGGADFCDLETNGSSNSTGYCIGFYTDALEPGPFVINNTGNQNVTLRLKSSHVAANFTGGASDELQWWLEDLDAGSCGTNTLAGAGWQDVNNTYHTACSGTSFSYADTQDTVNLHMRVYIGDDATFVGSERIATITAQGEN